MAADSFPSTKPAGKLYRREIHDFPLVVPRGVAIAEEHPDGLEFHDTVMADRDPMRRAGKVFDNVVDARIGITSFSRHVLKREKRRFSAFRLNHMNPGKKQMAGNLVDPVDGFLRDTRYLIMDHDPLFTACFRNMLKGSGAQPVRLHAQKSESECFRRTLRPVYQSECLNKIIPLGEKHLRLAIREYMEHYHKEQNHQGLDSHIILQDDSVGGSEGDIKKRSRLGGYFNYNYHDAA